MTRSPDGSQPDHTPVPGFTTFTTVDREAIRAEVLVEVDAIMKKWEMDDWGESFYQFVVQLRREIAELGREGAARVLPNPDERQAQRRD